MAGSITSILDLIEVSQSQKEVTANALFNAASPAMLYARRDKTSAGLTWGYYGGSLLINGSIVEVASGTLQLTPGRGNWIEADPSTGAVSLNNTGFTAGLIPLYLILTGDDSIIGYDDLRSAYSVSSGAIATHVGQTDPHTQYLTQADGDALYDALGAATSAVSAHDAASDPHTQYLTQARGDLRYPLLSSEGQANGLATLGADGKLASAQIPDIAIVDYLGTVNSQSAMLALTGQKGDWCIRSDDGKVYTITGGNPASAASWTAMSYPVGNGGTVTSVGLSVPGVLYSVSGSPITGSGTLSFALIPQTANTFLAGPTSGAAAAPTMRALVAADLPPQPFDLTAFYPGIPSASALVTRIPFARTVSFPSGLSGSVGIAKTAATAQTDFDIQKNGASVGTMRFAAGATAATFIAASAFSLAAGDVLSIIAPATADTTLSDIGLVLTGTR